jgi:hypothetical protein
VWSKCLSHAAPIPICWISRLGTHMRWKLPFALCLVLVTSAERRWAKSGAEESSRHTYRLVTGELCGSEIVVRSIPQVMCVPATYDDHPWELAVENRSKTRRHRAEWEAIRIVSDRPRTRNEPTFDNPRNV